MPLLLVHMLGFKVFWLDFNFSFKESPDDIFPQFKLIIHVTFMHMSLAIEFSDIP